MNKKIKLLKIQLTAAIFALIIVLISGFFVLGPELSRIASALSPNYNKLTGDSLDVNIWNNLDDDFLALTGDIAMQGNLNMGSNRITNLANPTGNNDAVNQGWVLSQISGASSIEDTSGNPLRMVCGSMPCTLANTTNPFPYILLITINTSAAGFSSIQAYLSSMDGYGNHYRVTGVNTIYNPQVDSYQIYIQFIDNYNPSFLISPQDAVDWGWVVNWCGLGT
jgi:hypothetical protein